MRIACEIDMQAVRKYLFIFYTDDELEEMTEDEMFEAYARHALNQKIFKNIAVCHDMGPDMP